MDETLPIILVVSSEASVLRALEADLGRRFGNDTRIVGADGPAAGLAQLEALADGAEPVALVIADQRMPEMTGVDFLAGAHTAASAGEADPARRARLHDGEPDRARDDARPDRLPPREAVVPRPRAVSGGERVPRRAGPNSQPAGFTMFRIAALENSARAHEIRDLLTRFNTPFAFHPSDSEEGGALLGEVGQAASRLPTAVRHDGRVLVDPTDGDLVEAVGGGTRLGVDVYDVAIVGAGPGRPLGGRLRRLGGARDDRPRAADLRRPGGLELAHPQRPRLHVGDRRPRPLLSRVRAGVAVRSEHGLRAGGERRCASRAPSASCGMADGQRGRPRAPSCSPSGVAWRRLGIPELEALIGAGVFYGAAVSEARAMRGRHVCVVGGGNSAGQAAAHLAKYADEVTLLVRGDSLAKSMSEYLIAELRGLPNVSVRLGCRSSSTARATSSWRRSSFATGQAARSSGSRPPGCS